MLVSSTGRLRFACSAALRSYAGGLATGVGCDAGAVITLPNGKAMELEGSDVALSMPAEWAPQAGTLIAWPRRPDVWRDAVRPAKAAYGQVIAAIARFQPVTVVAHPDQVCCCIAQDRQQPQHPAGAKVQHLQQARDPSCPLVRCCLLVYGL
jgi:Porphyromonas-type peptidyl-arginine deiminase